MFVICSDKKEARREAGYTLRQFCLAAKVNPLEWSEFENGYPVCWGLRRRQRILETLSLSENDLFRPVSHEEALRAAKTDETILPPGMV